jgi:hypothetical protein
MDDQGYQVLRRFLPRASLDLPETLALRPIFGRDRRRLQGALPANAPLRRLLETKLATTGKLPRDFVVLHSLAGCKEQPAHLDYVPDDALLATADADVPLGFLLACDDATRMVVWPGSHRAVRGADADAPLRSRVLRLRAGDAVLFRADLVHAGASYATENTRVHCYLDTPAVAHVHNRVLVLTKKETPALCQRIARRV